MPILETLSKVAGGVSRPSPAVLRGGAVALTALTWASYTATGFHLWSGAAWIVSLWLAGRSFAEGPPSPDTEAAPDAH